MDTIEKTSPNLRYQQPPLLMRNESGRFVRVTPARSSSRTGPAAARPSATSTTTATSTSSSATSASGRSCCATTAATQRNWLAHPSPRHALEPRRHRLPRQGRRGVRADAALHDHHRRRISVGQRQASAGRPRRPTPRRSCVEIRWPSGAVQTFENVKAGQTLVATEPADALRRSRRTMNRRADDSRAAHCSRCWPCSAGPTFGFAQGVSSRDVKPQPRGKPSGLPVQRPLHRRRANRPASPIRSSTAASTPSATSSKSSAAASPSSTTTTTAGSTSSS